ASLVYALLLIILYGALVESVHSHGPRRLGSSSIVALNKRGQSDSSSDGYTQRDCSMCQFQRQLVDGLSQGTLFTRTALTEIAFASTVVITYRPLEHTPAQVVHLHKPLR